jgi:4-aminobutyrate aminotransferase-like enzyme
VALARRLARVESRNVTRLETAVFWADAGGANVVDVDGNRFIDLTAGFGVAAAGHAVPGVAEAVARQAHRLTHAMGDVHPADVKVELLERLAGLAPGELDVSILSANGSDAVESALKTAVMATGRPGVVAFRSAYHGLGYGALSVTGLSRFRGPFEAQLQQGVRFAPFPGDPGTAASEPGTAASDAGRDRGAAETATDGVSAAAALDRVGELIAEAAGSEHPVGAVIVEPIQGRGGIRVPPAGFLPGLRRLCTELDVVLIFDEVYTGFGRTGEWFACQHEAVVPDLLVIGKSLAGGLPLSAVVGTREVMDAWPPSEGEALHTSTFLGNPVTCAAALAQVRALEEGRLIAAARSLGDRLAARLRRWVEARPWAVSTRGRGLMQAVELAESVPVDRVVTAALERGILVLAEGNALAFTPPLVITERQLDHALDVLEERLSDPIR